MPNFQATEGTNYFVGGYWLMNHQRTPDARKKECSDKYYMLYALIMHVYNLVSIDTLTRMLKTSVTCS